LEKGFAMKSRKTFVVAFALIVVIAAVDSGYSAFSRASTPERSFEFTYVTRIPELPAGARSSKIWIPLPQSDSYQTISDLRIESPFAYSTHRDSEYGNEYVYLEVPAAKVAAPAEVRVHFRATRQEHRVALGAQPIAAKTGAGAGSCSAFCSQTSACRSGESSGNFPRRRHREYKTRWRKRGPSTTT